ncbi:MAG: DUF916 and DUF3324 domain-containing protein [Actinomycetes bacterium]|jgi:hypothetical protein|nr:DUF916 and DUF3324 domain-containing protein [Actinomycetes bacterium]
MKTRNLQKPVKMPKRAKVAANTKTAATLFVTVLLACAFIMPHAIAAAGEVKFSVEALPPKTQRDSSVSYFDVRLKPGETERLRVRVTNDDSQPKQIRVSAISASTNSAGIIEYTRAGITDPSLTHPFNQLAHVANPDITLPPKSSQVVVTEVTMPDAEFDGVILGGIYVLDSAEHTTDNTRRDDAVIIDNRYSYALGVVLSENDTPVQPIIEGRNAFATLTDGYTSVVHGIRNMTPAIAKKWDLNIEVYRKDNPGDVIRHIKADDINMAPNSCMPYVLFWDGAIDAGDYVSRVVMRDSTANANNVSFELPWSISPAQAREMNREAVDAPTPRFPWLWVITIAALLLIIIMLLIVFGKRHHTDGGTGVSTPIEL